MTDAELKHRISTLPWCHALFVLTVFVTGTIFLTLDVLVLQVRIRNCPVINTSFVAFWYHLVLSIVQLSVGLFLSIELVVLSCRKRRSGTRAKHSRRFDEHLVGAVGATGQFITLHPDRYPALSAIATGQQPAQIDLVHFDIFGNDVDEAHGSTCCGRCRRHCCDDSTNADGCQSRCGWLQPITVLLVIILACQLASLIWFCSLRAAIRSPDGFFNSKVINLFVEAKVSYWDYENQTQTPSTALGPEGTIDRIPLDPDAQQCWLDIEAGFYCCGVTNWTDWMTNEATNMMTMQNVQQVPQSCFCPNVSLGETVCLQRDVEITSRGYLYNRGCLDPLTVMMDTLIRNQIIVISCCLVFLLIGFLSDIIYTFQTAHLVLKMHSERMS